MSRLMRCLFFIFICMAGLFCTPQKAEALSLCSLLCSCTIATNNIGFGNYDPIHGLPATATTTVTVNCQLLSGILSLLEPYTVGLSTGQSGSYTPRKMAGPSAGGLSYNLYTDMSMGTIWEDIGTSQNVSSSITVSVVNVVVGQTQTVYGQVPASQNVNVGSYTDMVTATVQF